MRARGCIIGAAAVLAVLAAVAAAVGPGLWRRARSAYAPISRMKDDQREFEAWTRQQRWQEPATPRVSPAELDAFLALRRELRGLDDQGLALRRRRPAAGRSRIDEVPAMMEGVGGLVSERLAAFRAHGLTAEEYDYLERLVYETWLRPLLEAGEDPAARDRAAREIEAAAARERAGPVTARLRAVAAEIRARIPEAPAGIPPDLHRLLLARATEIESQPLTRISARVPGRPRPRPEATASP